MDQSIVWFVVFLAAGIFINIRIAWLSKLIFRKDDTFSRIVLRFIGIFLIINAFHQLNLI
jgi:hypothetical protein